MSSSVTIPEGTGLFHLPLELPLAYGSALRGAQLAYEISGPADAPLVVAAGGISATRHVCATAGDDAPGWWEALVGPGRALDTRRVRVLAFDWLGGSGASTGPTNGGPRPFPIVSSRDQALALALLLDDLGVARLAAFAGASYGGMVALAFAELFPARIAKVCVIGAAHESHPRSSAWRSVQRRIVRLGLAAGAPHAQNALAIARALAMTTYRAKEELAERFAGAPSVAQGVVSFPVDAYLDARGRDFAARHAPETFLALSHAIDLHRVTPERITTPATLVGVASDELVPLAQVRELAQRLAGPVRLVELASRYGHDAFLKEIDALTTILAEEVLP